MALVGRIKNCIEWQDNGQLAALLGRIPIWILDRPGSAADIIERFERISDGSDDLEFLFLKVLMLEHNDCRASLSAVTQLVWTNEKTWEEEDFDAVMHLGIVCQNSEWIPEYLGFIQQTPDGFRIPARYAAAAIGNPFETQDDPHAVTTYFGMASASPYLAYPVQGPGPGFKSDVQETDASPPDGMIPIYVPESVMIEIMKKMDAAKGLKRA